MFAHPTRFIDKASIQVRVGSNSGDSGYDSGPDQRVLAFQAQEREDFWVKDTRDKPVALHAESDTSDDIQASRIAIVRDEIRRCNNSLGFIQATEAENVELKLKLFSYPPKLLHIDAAQRTEERASSAPEKIPSEPTIRKNIHQTYGTPLPQSTIFSSRSERPPYVKAFTNVIQKLPDDKKHILQHGCPCSKIRNQVSRDNVQGEEHDVTHTVDEDEEGGVEDVSHAADGVGIGAVEGESSLHNVSRTRSAVTKRSSKATRSTGKRSLPSKQGRKNGKSGGDDGENDGENSPTHGHTTPQSSQTWLCPFFILWFIEIFCPDIILHTPPPPLRQCCRPPTAIRNFSGLRYHLRRDHGAEIDETRLNDIISANFTGTDFQRYQQVWATLFPGVIFPEFFSSHLYDIQLCSHVQDILIQTFLALMASGTDETFPADILQRNTQASAWIVQMSLEMGAIFGSDLINGARERSRTNDLPQSMPQASGSSQGQTAPSTAMVEPTSSSTSALGEYAAFSSSSQTNNATAPSEQVQATSYLPPNAFIPDAGQPLPEGLGISPSTNMQIPVSQQESGRQQNSPSQHSTADISRSTSLQPLPAQRTITTPTLRSLEQTRQELLEEIERRRLLQEIADLRQQLATLSAQPNSGNSQGSWM